MEASHPAIAEPKRQAKRAVGSKLVSHTDSCAVILIGVAVRGCTAGRMGAAAAYEASAAADERAREGRGRSVRVACLSHPRAVGIPSCIVQWPSGRVAFFRLRRGCVDRVLVLWVCFGFPRAPERVQPARDDEPPSALQPLPPEMLKASGLHLLLWPVAWLCKTPGISHAESLDYFVEVKQTASRRSFCKARCLSQRSSVLECGTQRMPPFCAGLQEEVKLN